MSSQYRKIKYDTEGPYGTTEEKWLYVWSHDTVDITHVFDDDGEDSVLKIVNFCFCIFGSS